MKVLATCLFTALSAGCALNASSPQDPPGLYYKDPAAREKSEQLFDQALQMMQQPTLAAPVQEDGGNSGLWLQAGEYLKKVGVLEQSALLGNPRALSYLCIARGDVHGPDVIRPEGLAWCRIAQQALPTQGPVYEDVSARVNALETGLNPRAKRHAGKIEQELRAKMVAEQEL